MTTENNALTLIPSDDKTKIEIIPFGTDEKIQLNVAIVQNIIAVATKTGKKPDSAQAIKFMMLCKARHLNPFEGDAYLLGYDTQNGPQFSLITAHQVFLKRAEASKGFDGMESGVIIKTDKGVEEREGDITFEGEKLLGGWAKVHRSDQKFPFYRRLKLETFSTGQSRWSKDAAGMIVKCAEADALRSAFPTHLGGLYMAEERNPVEVEATVIPPARLPGAAPVTVESSTDKPALDENKKTPRGRKTPTAAKQDAPGPVGDVPDPDSAAARVEARLKADGYTVEEFMQVAIRNMWADTTAKGLADIEEGKLELFLDDWDQTKAELQAFRDQA